MRVTAGILLRLEPLRVIREAEVNLLSVKTNFLVRLDAIQRILDTGMVGGHIVTTVHEIVRHDVNHVDGLPDLGALFLGKSDHVNPLTRYRDGDELVLAKFLAQSSEEERVCFDLALLILVGDVFVIFAVAAGVFPVDVCIG